MVSPRTQVLPQLAYCPLFPVFPARRVEGVSVLRTIMNSNLVSRSSYEEHAKPISSPTVNLEEKVNWEWYPVQDIAIRHCRLIFLRFPYVFVPLQTWSISLYSLSCGRWFGHRRGVSRPCVFLSLEAGRTGALGRTKGEGRRDQRFG